MQNGILVAQHIRELVENRVIIASIPIDQEKQIQPATIDLRLGEDAYEVTHSRLPRQGQKIEDLIRDSIGSPIKLGKGALLRKGHVYIVPLLERVFLLPELQAKANPKSSAGRTDVFTRLLADGVREFDTLPAGYCGNLYVLLIPQSFNIMAHTGVSLNQLRLFTGEQALSDRELHLALRKHEFIYDQTGRPVIPNKLSIQGGLFLTVSLKPGVEYYVAKDTEAPVDLTKIKAHKKSDYWDVRNVDDSRIVLQPGEYHILATTERLRVPLDLAADIEAVDVRFGDVRSHYAGFVDCGWGYGLHGTEQGWQITLEVRAMQHGFELSDEQPVCRVRYERCLELTDRPYTKEHGANYANQIGPTLGKYFVD